jgi:hypothetical protein
MLYVYNNRRYDGEIWLAERQRGRVFCVEQSKCPDDPEVLGEVKSEIRGIPSWDCTPPTRSAAGELTKMAQQAERQRPHRQEGYRRYSIENRIQDLPGVR